MAKPIKSIPPAETPKKRSTIKLVITIITALGLIIASGAAGWYLSKSSDHGEGIKKYLQPAPKFIRLDTFTVNLYHNPGEEERILQTVINLEIQDGDLEEKIRLFMPKIYNNLLILLSKKRASELSTAEGKQQLAREIKAETELVLGLRNAPAGNATSSTEQVSNSSPAPAETASGGESHSGIVSVLFTSFIIQ